MKNYRLHFLVGTMLLTNLAYGQSNFTASDTLFQNMSKLYESSFKGDVKEELLLFTPPTTDRVYLDFVGSGDIQKSISQGNNVSANTGIGVIFEKYSGTKKLFQSFELEATLNIASTSDSVRAEFINDELSNRRDFGTYILNPISTRQSLYINSNTYFGYKDDWKIYNFIVSNIISGVNIRAITSNNVWAYKDSISNVGALALRVGVFHEFIPDNFRIGKKDSEDYGRSKYSIFLGLNYSYRAIIGDITADKNEELMEKILGSQQQSFSGVEINFGFRLNNLRAEFQMPILKKDPSSIEGLTDTQFLFSIKFVGGFGLKLNPSEEDPDA